MDNLQNEFMLARLAMAVDCEGSITIAKQQDSRRKGGYRYYIVVHIYNTNEGLIDWFVSNFGFSKHQHGTPNKPNHKQSYVAYATRFKAEQVLYGIKPYLIIKGRLADLALELQSTMTHGNKLGVPDFILQQREWLWQEARALNQKGRPQN